MKVFTVKLKAAYNQKIHTDNVSLILRIGYFEKKNHWGTLRKFYTLTPNESPRWVIWSEIAQALFLST